MLCPLFASQQPMQGGAASSRLLKGKHIRYSHDNDDEGSDMDSDSSTDSNDVSNNSGGEGEGEGEEEGEGESMVDVDAPTIPRGFVSGNVFSLVLQHLM